MAIDQAVQDKALRRLAIIEGQLRGLRRMIEERQYCVDILTQISAIHEPCAELARSWCATTSRPASPKACRATAAAAL